MADPPRVEFEFRQLVAYSNVHANAARRWIDAGIIRPWIHGEGQGTRRLFRAREVVLVRLCDRLHRLGLGETELRIVIMVIDAAFTAYAMETGRTYVWIGIAPADAAVHDARLGGFSATKGSAKEAARSQPSIDFATRDEILAFLEKGEFGILVNIADLVRDAEQQTGTPVK